MRVSEANAVAAELTGGAPKVAARLATLAERSCTEVETPLQKGLVLRRVVRARPGDAA